MSHYEQGVSVILVDWNRIAFFTGVKYFWKMKNISIFYKNISIFHKNISMFQFDDWDNYAYDYAARNSIDVGTFLGLCLAELSDKWVDRDIFITFI